jgi:hypothetical protein
MKCATLLAGALAAWIAGGCGSHAEQPAGGSISRDTDGAPPLGPGGQLEVYGVWHCSDDACIWSKNRSVADFDAKNHWLVDRGDARPSVNVVILSFVNPVKLLDRTNDDQTVNGIPVGMTSEVVQYFESRGIRVMLSIGGITYTSDWDQALAADSATLGLNAAAAAEQLGVGIEIDYENSGSPNLEGLQAFVDAYRSKLPYDRAGTNHAARLTIDLAAGTRWMVPLAAKATRDWLDPAHPVLDYANAMVAGRSQPSASVAQSQWLEHVDGNPRMTPPVPPLAPAKLTGSLWLHGDSTECSTFSGSVTEGTAPFVKSVAGTVGSTPGLLGYMFWAAECEGTKTVCTTPPHSCESGIGAGAEALDIPIPMPPLRQE